MAVTLRTVKQNAEQLAGKLDAEVTNHQSVVGDVRKEIGDVRGKLLALLHKRSIKEKDQRDSDAPPGSFVRRVEWQVNNLSDVIKDTPKNESIFSPEFSVLGVAGFKLEFFPNGRESTHVEGFCALFLWCPAGVKIKYRLRLGSHGHAPDEDEYATKVGRGHSNFCNLQKHIDHETDSVLVGIDIMNIGLRDKHTPGMKITSECLESAIETEAECLRNMYMNRVEWTIKGLNRTMEGMPHGCGLAITSPVFSIAAVPRMLLEFFPCGVAPGSKEGTCGVYVRCPPGTSVSLTLFVGKCEKGPIWTVFDSMAAKGLPEFCVLEDNLINDYKDVVVGVHINDTKRDKKEPSTLILT